MSPKFQHDCEKCRFLGHFHGHDIYICKATELSYSNILARYGNDGPEYASDFLGHLQQKLVDDFRCVHASDEKIHTGEPIPSQVAMTMGLAYEATRDLLPCPRSSRSSSAVTVSASPRTSGSVCRTSRAIATPSWP